MKVTVHEKPRSDEPSVAVSNQVTDTRGRVIRYRELDPLQESRLILAIGAQAAMNPVYVNVYAIPAARVSDIDGDEYAIPQTQAQVDAMISILGREGMDALATQFFPTGDCNQGDDIPRTATKNSP
ncbi:MULTISPECIES: hypothetical protein [unclassified Enterobacter]|uniref:hypothetical protein n=1 Tax=unclassified Enterobacter TaxID=2608935 RepID=UPI0015CD8459|nr:MULTISPECIES: hypothetical protein [unclassified Enterobacter]MBB3307703.1 hypothetical protein [Enterobacter sp. Sphag1F]NYI16515.1 hypothetical protein [Enterobacter sp. Sphag71]